MTDDQKGNRIWRTMGLVSTISSYIVGGTVGGVFIGLWLGNQFGAKPFFIITFLLLGLGTGFYGVYKAVEPFLGEGQK
ncbi:AtpZ/AtpI family protein [Bacillus sp. JCM 19034]|uniref:AtpZ/AtpI family protein n=1 Tax=Bacillus sp. JCM 19034 TaxID=1481928 RepID=UPI000784C27F|nr:AtpZ/AtpI family protein [Bacillus sp. JCM 19034]